MTTLSEEAVKVGTKVFGLLVEAHIRCNTSGKCTCNTFDIQDFPEEHREVILAYLNGEIDSVTAIYVTMQRAAKEPVVGHCKDCAHWAKPEWSATTVCSFEGEDWPQRDDSFSTCADAADDTNLSSWLETGPMFGCTRFQAKTHRECIDTIQEAAE